MRKDSKIPAILALFEANPDGYLTRSQVDEAIGKNCAYQLFTLSTTGRLFKLTKGPNTRYYLTAAAMDAGRADWEAYISDEALRQRKNALQRQLDTRHREAERAKRPPTIKQQILRIYAQNPEVGLTRAQIRGRLGTDSESSVNTVVCRMCRDGEMFAARSRNYVLYYASQDAKTADRDNFRAASAAENLRCSRARLQPNRAKVNPDLRKQIHKAEWDSAEVHIPPGVQVQVLPGFERFGCPVRAKLAMMP